MDKQSVVIQNIQRSVDIKQRLMDDTELVATIGRIADLMVECYQNDGKVLFCGNGGSAADAQHLAAELSGRYYYDRPPLFAEALHVNTSYLTAVANDYSYDEVFSRMVKAAGRTGDILIGLSTSGDSINVLKALKQARSQSMTTIGLTGENSKSMQDVCDFVIAVPSKDTPRIQECHILIGHILCEITEQSLFPR